MSQTPSSTPLNWRAWVLPVLLLLLWGFVTGAEYVDTRIIVPPQSVLESGWKELQKTDFYEGVALSLWRDVSGFGLGALLGIAAGVLLGVAPWASHLFGPTFHTLRQISLFAWLPLLSAIAGSGNLSKVIFIAFSTFYPVVLATLHGVQSIHPAHREVAKVYGFTPYQTLGRLILPSAAPQILSGLKLGLVYAWIATIGAEFLLYDFSNGLGMVVQRGRSAFRVDVILFGLLVIGILGYAFNRLAEWSERRLLHWRPPTQ